MTSVETGGKRLVWLAEGTPGQTWQVKDADLARGLWERSEMLGQ